MSEGQFWKTKAGQEVMRLIRAAADIAKPRHDDRGPQRLGTPAEHTKPDRQ